ncbi:hypothetical protein N431DRAFT_531159 [Stipitochalara longipes BDJ]|nr:hypothetical protein N431DRAFT_531159 [Stipitochalara longipes BDJ]
MVWRLHSDQKLRPQLEPPPPIIEETQHDQRAPIPSSFAGDEQRPTWEQQGFATYSAQYKFTTGLSRINNLCAIYPDISPRLQTLRRCLEELSLPLDSQRFVVDDEREDKEVDVEKTRVWKFRFLDLMIEMLLKEKGMTDKELRNVLMYAETVLREFREKLDVDGKEGKA